MRSATGTRSLPHSVAPVATLIGLVLIALSLLVFTSMATAPGFGPVEQHEERVIDETAMQAYPVPISYGVATRVSVHFEFPEQPGTAAILDCAAYSRLLQEGAPVAEPSGSAGTSGRLERVVAPDLFGDAEERSGGCGFLYVVVLWDLQGETAAANRPHVTVETSPGVLPGAVLTGSALVGCAGLALALIGGTAWARARTARRTSSKDDDAYVAETLLAVVHETGDWLARMRRYLIAAGILGIFLWYPLVLPWAWRHFTAGASGNLLPWSLGVAALILLGVLTAAWLRAYLRLDRQLVDWRERVDRLRAREERLLSDLEAAG